MDVVVISRSFATFCLPACIVQLEFSRSRACLEVARPGGGERRQAEHSEEAAARFSGQGNRLLGHVGLQ